MSETLTTKVTEEGVVIPPEWFDGVEEVEMTRENGRVIVNPKKKIPKDDPIWNLGKNPVVEDNGPTDGSVNHDKYIYG